MAAQKRAGCRISAKTSCNGASGARPDRDPGPDSRSPRGEFYLHSWSSTHRLPPGSNSKQTEASKMAETAGLLTAVLQREHTTLRRHFCWECERRGVVRSSLSSCRRRVRASVSLFLNRLATVFLGGSETSDEEEVSLKLGQSGFTKPRSSRLWFPQWNWNCTHFSVSVSCLSLLAYSLCFLDPSGFLIEESLIVRLVFNSSSLLYHIQALRST